jgi:hypothetical protein
VRRGRCRAAALLQNPYSRQRPLPLLHPCRRTRRRRRHGLPAPVGLCLSGEGQPYNEAPQQVPPVLVCRDRGVARAVHLRDTGVAGASARARTRAARSSSSWRNRWGQQRRCKPLATPQPHLLHQQPAREASAGQPRVGLERRQVRGKRAECGQCGSLEGLTSTNATAETAALQPLPHPANHGCTDARAACDPSPTCTAPRYCGSARPMVAGSAPYSALTNAVTSARHAARGPGASVTREYQVTRPGWGPLLAWRRPSLHMVQQLPREAAPCGQRSGGACLGGAGGKTAMTTKLLGGWPVLRGNAAGWLWVPAVSRRGVEAMGTCRAQAHPLPVFGAPLHTPAGRRAWLAPPPPCATRR